MNSKVVGIEPKQGPGSGSILVPEQKPCYFKESKCTIWIENKIGLL